MLRVSREAVVSTQHMIDVDGVKLDLMDLYETLMELKGVGNIRVTNQAMIKVLKARRVLNYEGSRDVAATKGPKFDEFLAELEPKVNKAYRGKYTVTKASIRKVQKQIDEWSWK